jgi:hypothetical protein
MLVREELRAAEREFKPDGSKNVIFIETNTTRPGYGRVVHSAPKDVNHDFIFHDNETNKYYLSSSGIIKGQLDMLGEGPRDKLQYVQQGPAISSHDKNPMDGFSSNLTASGIPYPSGLLPTGTICNSSEKLDRIFENPSRTLFFSISTRSKPKWRLGSNTCIR